ncbi:S66 peptidase family protein [Simkania sp.]|uniref:S66 peptidase family protein n=1 Tax=Simkania sp. TaxID=34094 RepID=UPI003B523CF5
MMIEPPPLQAGDTIAIVAPASISRKVGELEACVHTLEEKGFKVKLAANLGNQWGNFCGSDTERATGIMEAFQDEGVKAIWCLRGGYGSGRLLGQLDYDVIRQNPKIFIGMSDITALHVALNQKAGLITYLGPNANFIFATEEDRSFAEEHAWKVLLGAQETLIFEGGETLVSGKAKGELTGGNLALLAAHVGTPWQIETRGKILLLEEVNEFSYRVDRMLCQLLQAGLLDDIAGLILSSWSGCDPQHSQDFELEQVLKNYFQNASYPVLLEFPSGHIENQATLPLGLVVELDAESKTLKIY